MQKSRSFVSPHDVSSAEWFAFTVNPSPKELASVYEAKDPFRTFKMYLKKILNDFHSDINYEAFIELSDKGRFHSHMRIQFLSAESIIYFYYFLYKNNNKMQFKFGTYMDEELKSEKTWDEYIRKQFKFWQSLEKDSRICKIQPPQKNIVDLISTEDIDTI